MAVVLASIGLYGFVSWGVSQSTKEIAIRIALGATSGELHRMVLLRGLRYHTSTSRSPKISSSRINNDRTPPIENALRRVDPAGRAGSRVISPGLVFQYHSPAAYLIHHLPYFAEDHRSDPRAELVFAGEVPGGSDCTAEIRAQFVPRFGAGYYRVTERNGDGKIKATWVLQVGDATETDNDLFEESEYTEEAESLEFSRLREQIERIEQRLAAQQPTIQPPQQGTSLGELIQSVKALDELRGQQSLTSKVREVEELRAMLQASTPVTPTTTEPSDALTFLIKTELSPDSESRELMRKARALLNGGGPIAPEESQPNWQDVVSTAIETWGPAVTPIIQSIVAGLTAKVTGQQASTSGNQQAAQQTPPQPNPAQVELSAVLTMLLQRLAQNERVEPCAAAVDQLLLRYPQLEPFLSGWINDSPEDVLRSISQIPDYAHLVDLPLALGWITDFQKCFDEPATATGTEAEGSSKGTTP
jgi:hypothetical protein